jgi:uncharacterized protein YdeI (YjbR/CyaY-like superfamily)
MLSTEMEETLKWGAPAYIINKKNVVGLGAFKSYAGLWFFQGALLKDPKKLLINAQEGKTNAMRQMRFASLDDLDINVIRAYVDEAIQNQKAGMEIKPVSKREFKIPEEMGKAFENDAGLKEKFESFSHSHRREFAEYVSEAKRPETRIRRLEKIIPMIKNTKGLNDRYR